MYQILHSEVLTSRSSGGEVRIVIVQDSAVGTCIIYQSNHQRQKLGQNMNNYMSKTGTIYKDCPAFVVMLSLHPECVLYSLNCF